MKNLKLLSFWLLFGMLILAWCEKANTQEQYACETDDVCPIEWLDNSHRNYEEEAVEEEVSEEPLMRKMVVDENTSPDEVEAEITETCANIGWTWNDWECTLEDGTTVMF